MSAAAADEWFSNESGANFVTVMDNMSGHVHNASRTEQCTSSAACIVNGIFSLAYFFYHARMDDICL